ncbi:MAG: hypothetical protein JHC95_13340 [Solirubrobacteraceae bacterium]|nr:hypothetical protein [Solirubrobacteraceae bacterium]
MRNPVRSEADAFHIAYGAGALIGASVLLVALVDPLVGVALFVGGLLGACIWEFGTTDPDARQPLREAAEEHRRDVRADRRRVLVVANRTLRSDTLRDELRARGKEGAEIRVVAPIIVSRAHYIVSDVDHEMADARERLAEALEWATAEGLDMSGRVGDPMAAFAAVEDELRLFGPDAVVVSTHPPGQSNWLETGIVERLRGQLDVPVAHVVAAAERTPVPH